MRHLLPLPVTPHKGQSFSLRMPSNSPPILSRVLFAQDTYIVPKADGRIIVGATVEPGRFDGDVTPEGMMHCLSEATRLIPALGELPIEESWAGLRPTTPDKCPILGLTEQWDNVYIAGGYWRNGVLLAPKTGQLIGDLIVNNGDVTALSEEDRALLNAFSWERFTKKGGGKALAANARYAATFYPVHKRSTDGVAVSVGTELGFYEGAAAARGDREKDRKAMFGISEEEEEALERAAATGVGDAQAFSFGDEGDGWMVKGAGKSSDAVEDVNMGETMAVEADPDALTVGMKEVGGDETNISLAASGEKSDLSSIYEKIKANKAKAAESITMGDTIEPRADPGFRIYHVDSVTRETTEVPPFTSPGEFLQMKAEGKLTSKPLEEEPIRSSATKSSEAAGAVMNQPSSGGEDSQPLFDGYSAIREAYGEGTTDEATAESTRRARMSNRIKTSEIDESKIGAMFMPPGSSATTPAASPSAPGITPSSSTSPEHWADDLSSVYDKIRANKELASHDIEMGEAVEVRPTLNFTIYHVDSKTREVREVPQYTSPGQFLDSIEQAKAASQTAVNGARTPKASVPNNDKINEEVVPTAIIEDADSDIIEKEQPYSDEKTLDGYQAIQESNSAASREEELRRMKEARMANRARKSEIMGGAPSL